MYQPFTIRDINYWKDFGISLNTLIAYKVYSANKVWIDDKLIKYYTEHNPIYAYYIRDGIYKIYDPLAEKREFKWLFNGNVDDILGIDQLPPDGDRVVITKSLKDVMLFYEFGIPACSLQSESPTMPEWLYKSLTYRFKQVFLMFDNDAHGLAFSNKIKQNHPLVEIIYIPINLQTKDISDFYVKYGARSTGQMISILTQD